MANDLPYPVPASVTVVFPRVIAGTVQAHPYPVVVTLSGLALGVYGSTVGFAGTKTVWASPRALDNGGGTISNSSSLASYAARAASDWYLWQLGKAESRYEGVLSWVMEGHTEVVEFEHTIDRISTRTLRGPWLDHFEGEWTPPGSGGGDGGGACCDLVKLQTTDCLTATGPSNSVTLYYNGAGRWISTDALTYPGGSGLVEFWYAAGTLHAALGAGAYGIMLELERDCVGCCFRGGPLTGHAPASGSTVCSGPVFSVCFDCATCPGISTVCCPGVDAPPYLRINATGSGTNSCMTGVYLMRYYSVAPGGWNACAYDVCGKVQMRFHLECVQSAGPTYGQFVLSVDYCTTAGFHGVGSEPVSGTPAVVSCEPFEMTFVLGGPNDTATTGPNTVTYVITPGAAGGGGWCQDCGVVNRTPPVTLAATVTGGSGAFSSVPSLLTFDYFADYPTNYFVGNEQFATGYSPWTRAFITFLPPGDLSNDPGDFQGCRPPYLLFQYPNGDPDAGPVLYTGVYYKARPNYDCIPFFAIFDVDDGGGSSCTVVVME